MECANSLRLDRCAGTLPLRRQLLCLVRVVKDAVTHTHDQMGQPSSSVPDSRWPVLFVALAVLLALNLYAGEIRHDGDRRPGRSSRPHSRKEQKHEEG